MTWTSPFAVRRSGVLTGRWLVFVALAGGVIPAGAHEEHVEQQVTFSCIAWFLLTYTFPLLNRTLGPAGTFWTYAAICLGGWVLVWWAVPETKGKTLEEIERYWRPQA